MAGWWLDRDINAHIRGAPAQPVTSMEQAEVLPARVNKDEDSHKLISIKTPTPEPQDNVRSEDIQDGKNTTIDEDSTSESVPKQSASSSSQPDHSFSKNQNKSSGNDANTEVKILASGSEDATVLSPDNIDEIGPSAPVNSEQEHKHSGDLRKNSIAAMKELGNPIATEISDGLPTGDVAAVTFDFQKFMECLRMKSADPIARYIKSFLQEFSRAVWTPRQQEKIISDFHKFISVKLRDYEPFASMDKREQLNTLEGVEKLIMNRLYNRTFPPSMPPILRTDGHNEDLLKDEVFEEKMRLWGWVEGRHLDIKEEYLKSQFIRLATTELRRLGQFKSPRDKMICILNCSKVIYALIRQARLEQNADSFLPLLIYVVLKAGPEHLVSTINYIQRFRGREFQRGETAYYLSTLASAVTFIETLDQTSLTITTEEFEQRMSESALAESKRKSKRLEEQSPFEEGEQQQILHEGESSAAVLTASAGMLVDRVKKLTTKFFEEIGGPDGSSPANAHVPTSSQQISANGAQSYREQERIAKNASWEEFRLEQNQREQFLETLATLQSMFPSLDKDVIEDVLRQNGMNIGSSVDICLALVR